MPTKSAHRRPGGRAAARAPRRGPRGDRSARRRDRDGGARTGRDGAVPAAPPAHDPDPSTARPIRDRANAPVSTPKEEE
ncbi:hypothetical protein [Actinomadura atramentaria]|uniref:hypothetical protein n=1 Tax=Actinomadura atramentaria TaxID=1990 RepID=UPI0003781692|nr:hypothetical protein [Actinomadura atramentaria]